MVKIGQFTTSCKTQFTRYNRLSNRLNNRLNNRLHRVNKHSTIFFNRFDNRIDNRLYRVNGVKVRHSSKQKI